MQRIMMALYGDRIWHGSLTFWSKLCCIAVALLTLCACADLTGPETLGDACKLLSERYHRECGHQPFFPNNEIISRPFLDKTSALPGRGFVIGIPAGISVMGDIGQEKDMLVLVLSDGMVIPDRIFQIKSKRENLSDLNNEEIDDNVLYKYRGILSSDKNDMCYAGFSRGVQQAQAYCISPDRFYAAKNITTIDNDVSKFEFDRAALLFMDISEFVTGDGISIALHHPLFGALDVNVAVGGNVRKIDIDRGSRPSQNEFVDLKINQPGIYKIELNIDGFTEQYEFYVTRDNIAISENGIAGIRFSSLAWRRNHKYSALQVSVHCIGKREDAEPVCGALSDMARQLGHPLSENISGHFVHEGPIAWPSIVSTYELRNPKDLKLITGTLLQVESAKDDWPQKTFVEWVGPSGTGFCSHRGCSHLSEGVFDTAGDQDYSSWSMYYLP